MKQLIVNADDFGYAGGVNRGILAGFRKGIITSASLLANGAAFEDAVARAKTEPELDVGCHLNLVEGTPVSPPGTIPHLVRADGKFHSLVDLAARLAAGLLPAVEIERECSAQIEKVLRAGIQPSHVDTHKHTHLAPRVAAAVARLARRYSVEWVRRPFENCGATDRHSPVAGILAICFDPLARSFKRRMIAEQMRMPDFFTGFELTGRWTPRAIEDTLAALQPGITELMCHPGYYDAELEASPTRLKQQRETELEILTDPVLRRRAKELGITLTSFRRASATPLQSGTGSEPVLRGLSAC